MKNTDIAEKDNKFTYRMDLPMSKKASFIMEMANMVVSNELGYISILKDVIFDYCIIKYYTDIVLFEKEGDFSIDIAESFINSNKETIEKIKKEITRKDELYAACVDAIEYRKNSLSNCEKISVLNNSIEMLINKPDYLSELLISLKGFLDKAKDREIDMNVVNKLADIIPVMKEMGGKEVAKTIVNEFHNDKAE